MTADRELFEAAKPMQGLADYLRAQACALDVHCTARRANDFDPSIVALRAWADEVEAALRAAAPKTQPLSDHPIPTPAMSAQARSPDKEQPPIRHDYPACATFRGGKCTCDEADKLCPQCGTEEWDRVDAERGRERDVPFNRCCRCEHEWEAK